MSISTTALARACSRRPGRTLAVWGVVLLLSVVAIATLLGGTISTDQGISAATDSQRGYDLLGQRLPSPDVPDELVVVRSERYTVGDPEFTRFLGVSQRSLGAVRLLGAEVSNDRHAVLVPIQLGHDPEGAVEGVIAAVRHADDDPDFDVAITGEFTLDRDFSELSQQDLQNGELLFGLPAALIVLVLVFGAVVAGLVPVLLALVSIVVALGLTAVLGTQFELSYFIVNMISGMGLALGIDYALFIVSRFREERHRGHDKLAAIETSGATSSRAVLFSGLAFVVAMVGMLLVPAMIMRSLALGAILVGITSVAAALTLLPAVLSLLGDRVNALRVPVIGRSAEAGTDVEGRFWHWAIGGVLRRPVPALVLVVGLLVTLAIPVLTLQTGTSGVSTLPDRFESKRGYLALGRDFAAGLDSPVLIVVDAQANAPPVQAAIARLESRLGALGVFGPPSVRTSGDLALVTAPLTADPLGERATAAVRELRATTIPAAFRGVDAEVLVTGDTAEQVDFAEIMDFWLPIVFAFVLAASFVLLTVVFRSIVVAATAIVLNLLSVGAAYGLLVLVFQHGVGADLLGFQTVDAVEAWVPLFLFSVLFGLSMDYNVFILSRIRESYLATGDNEASVAHGVASTARLITGAALIIIVVFTGFAAGELVMFQQMGFGVAVALAIDATLVRTVLLPATMKLLGRWNWYLPRWLGWLPRVGVEGPAPAAKPV